MRPSHSHSGRQRTATSVCIVLSIAAGLMLGACRPRPPETPPAPVPPGPEVPAGTARTAAGSVAGTVAASPPEAPASSTSAVAAPAARTSASKAPPRLEDMQLAVASAKLGVPVDLRYQFDAAIEPGRPVTLHLAAVPRIEGSNLTVSIREVPGIDAVAAPMTAQKASARQAYRQQLSVTRRAGADAPAELRVLVRMDVAEGSAFGYFSVPLTPAGDALPTEKD